MVEKKLSPKQEQIRDRNEKIKVLYEEGLSYKDIMSSVGVSRTLLTEYINKVLIMTDSYSIRQENKNLLKVKNKVEDNVIIDNEGVEGKKSAESIVNDIVENTDIIEVSEPDSDDLNLSDILLECYIKGLTLVQTSQVTGKSTKSISGKFYSLSNNPELLEMRENAILYGGYRSIKKKKEENYESVKEYYEAGLSYMEIGEKVGLHPSSVGKYINQNLLNSESYNIRKSVLESKRNQCEKEPRWSRFVRTEENYNLIKWCYENGLNKRVTTDKVGCSYPTITAIFKELDATNSKSIRDGVLEQKHIDLINSFRVCFNEGLSINAAARKLKKDPKIISKYYKQFKEEQ